MKILYITNLFYLICYYQLLGYNPGFPSRFPRDLTFEFPDYTEPQLRRIFLDMVKERNFRLQSPKELNGVSIAKVVSRRIAAGSGRKGFGNGREVRVTLEQFIINQSERLGTMELFGKIILDRDFEILKRCDTIGDRPEFENSDVLKELGAMVGLKKVKETLTGLLHLQLQNYDNEIRGDRVQRISLHRVFLGNSGTGM